MSQLHLHLHRHYLSLPHSSLRSRFPSLPSLRRRAASSPPSNSPLSLNSTKSTVFRPLTLVRSRFSESDITPQFELDKPQKRANGIFLPYLWLNTSFRNLLSSNIFFLYIFGKIVEEEKGNFGLWLSYLFTGVGANLVSWLALPPNSVSAGSSGAVFGLFVISVLVKMSRDWRNFLEVLILGQFVMKRVFEAAQASAGLLETIFGGFELLTIIQTLKPIAQFSGALVGVLLVWLLSKFPSKPVDQEVKNSSKSEATFECKADKTIDNLKNSL